MPLEICSLFAIKVGCEAKTNSFIAVFLDAWTPSQRADRDRDAGTPFSGRATFLFFVRVASPPSHDDATNFERANPNDALRGTGQAGTRLL